MGIIEGKEHPGLEMTYDENGEPDVLHINLYECDIKIINILIELGVLTKEDVPYRFNTQQVEPH